MTVEQEPVGWKWPPKTAELTRRVREGETAFEWEGLAREIYFRAPDSAWVMLTKDGDRQVDQWECGGLEDLMLMLTGEDHPAPIDHSSDYPDNP